MIHPKGNVVRRNNGGRDGLQQLHQEFLDFVLLACAAVDDQQIVLVSLGGFNVLRQSGQAALQARDGLRQFEGLARQILLVAVVLFEVSGA